jgi:hypothetical protein
MLQEVNPPDASPHRLRFFKESAQSHTIRRCFQQNDVLHNLFRQGLLTAASFLPISG